MQVFNVCLYLYCDHGHFRIRIGIGFLCLFSRCHIHCALNIWRGHNRSKRNRSGRKGKTIWRNREMLCVLFILFNFFLPVGFCVFFLLASTVGSVYFSHIYIFFSFYSSISSHRLSCWNNPINFLGGRTQFPTFPFIVSDTCVIECDGVCFLFLFVLGVGVAFITAVTRIYFRYNSYCVAAR